MNDSASDILKPAILCGGALGFLAGLPVFDLFNCCTCCSMAIGAGFFAAYLYSKTCARAGLPFDAGRAAGVGALTGFFWGLSSAVVSTLITVAFGEVLAEWFMPILEGQPVNATGVRWTRWGWPWSRAPRRCRSSSRR